MDIKQLRNFLAVFEEGSFSKAAARLHSTQPGVSVQIAALEKALNAKLFERHARGIKPTAAGRKLHQHAVQILHDTNQAADEIRRLSGALSGTIAAGIPPTLSKAILAPVLTDYVEHHRNVGIRIVEAYSTTLIGLLESRELDFAFVTHVPDHPALKFIPVYQDRFVLVSGKKLGLDPRKPARLDRPPYLKLVIPSLRHGLHRLLDEPLQTRRIVPERLIEIDGLAGALEFISTSEWAALLPVAAVFDHLDELRLQVNRIAGDEIRINYFMAHVATEPMPPAAEAFVKVARRELNRMTKHWAASGGASRPWSAASARPGGRRRRLNSPAARARRSRA